MLVTRSRLEQSRFEGGGRIRGAERAVVA